MTSKKFPVKEHSSPPDSIAESASPFLDEELFSNAELVGGEHLDTRLEMFLLESPFLSAFEKTVSDDLDESEIGEIEGFEDYLDDDVDEEFEELEEKEEFSKESDLDDALDEEVDEFFGEDELEEFEGNLDEEGVDQKLKVDDEFLEESDREAPLEKESEEFIGELEEEEFTEEREEGGEFEVSESTEDLYDSEETNAEGEYGDNEADHELRFDQYEIDYEDEGDENDFDDEGDEYEEGDHLTYEPEEEEYQRSFSEEEPFKHVNSLIRNILATAKAEYRKWSYGKLKETAPEARPYLEKYWKYGAKKNVASVRRRIRKRSPWSAAFISYIIFKSGGVPPFRRSGGHYVYAAKAKRNRARSKYDQPVSMWLYRIHEVKPQVGDILFNARVSRDISRNGANFDNVDNGNNWATHSDIIIAVNDDNITVIGGNVSDSVGKKRRRLDSNGYVKLRGIKDKEYFGILRFFSPGQLPRVQTQKYNKPSILSLFSKIGLDAYDFVRMSIRLFAAIGEGQDENKLTNFVFYYKYPSKKGQKLKKGEPLAKEWIRIRDLFIRPLLRELNTTASRPTTIRPGDSANISESGPFGKLVVDTNVPALRNSYPEYQFTTNDALWLARFVEGEAGNLDNADGHAVIWAMFNRFGMVRHQVPSWTSFAVFLQKYSTTLQPILNSVGAAKRVWRNHNNDPKKYPIVKGDGTYKKKNKRTGQWEDTGIQKVQYMRHINLQKKSWKRLSPAIRSMVIRILSGQIPNPGIGIATHFASTKIYYYDKYRKKPSDRQWREFTQQYAKTKKWIWIGDKMNLNQKKNAFFIQTRFRNVPPSAIKIENVQKSV